MSENKIKTTHGKPELEFAYDISHSGERAAGIAPYTNRVRVIVSYCPGGDIAEFESATVEFLRKWFDGAKISCITDMEH